MIKHAPVFALNGSYDEIETFAIGIFNFGNGSYEGNPALHYFGGNFTAQNVSNGDISVLTNSTPALLEYCPPQVTKKTIGLQR